jgi:hypothetical protein
MFVNLYETVNTLKTPIPGTVQYSDEHQDKIFRIHVEDAKYVRDNKDKFLLTDETQRWIVGDILANIEFFYEDDCDDCGDYVGYMPDKKETIMLVEELRNLYDSFTITNPTF